MELNPQWAEILKILCSIVLGGLIGLEREWASKPAGLRTHMLVAGSATLFVVLGDFMIEQFTSTQITTVLQADPIRIMEAIITGISFLGAGTIIFKNQKSTVEGLTTAASILFVSGIGIAVALGEILMAVILTFMVILILLGLGLLQDWVEKGKNKYKQQQQ